VVTSQNFWRRRFLRVINFIMMVSLGLGFHFGGKSLGSWTINIALNVPDALLWFICELRNQRSFAQHLVRLVPKFRRLLSVKKSNRYV